MNWKTISRNIGYALLVSALFMFLSVLVSVCNGADSALTPLVISFTITFVCGIFPFIFVRRTSAISLKEGYVIITLSWLLSFVFGMLPYALWGGPMTLDNAWFESVSGFTTTGSTAIADVEALPRGLLFWRASTHFIGGLGVVVFLLLIIPGSSPMKLRLANMELSSLSKGEYSVRANRTVYVFAAVYIGLAVVAFLCYWAAGMPAFDAICHAMSVCATGGFSSRNQSIAAFDSRLIEGLTMLFMYLSSLHFGLVFLSFALRSLKPLRKPVIKFYTLCILCVGVLLGLGFKFCAIEDNVWRALWNGLFQTLCVSSTTGFTIMDNSLWPLPLSLLLLFMAVMCGCAGSTSGGVKADRVLLLLKASACHIRRILHPTSVGEVKLGSHVLKDDEVFPHLLYIATYCVLIAISALLTMSLGVDNQNALAASVTSLGNVGPALGQMGTLGSFAGAPEAAKFIYTVDMFLGRVEIYPVLAVVAMIFDRRSR